MKLWHTLSPLAVLPLVLLAAPAHAQLTLNFAPSAQAGSPGSILNFTGTLSNPTTAAVFLNSDSLTFNGPASLDDSPFFTYSPLSLDPMGTVDGNNNPTDSYTGGFFDVTIDPSAAPGTYTGTFTILGGGDSVALDPVATQDFSITVLPAAVPEASTLLSFGVLLSLGFGGWAVSARRKSVSR